MERSVVKMSQFDQLSEPSISWQELTQQANQAYYFTIMNRHGLFMRTP
ncbi:hypothetical protein DmGdi_21510 [Gluconobacter sp. Gdi]|nr:hypothetical protein DmGdi_21510 [Gluconobacter sp. Gdi]